MQGRCRATGKQPDQEGHDTRTGPGGQVAGDEDSGVKRFRLIREYSATVGATEGNIIAAIITIQTLMNQPNVPRPVQGPRPIPAIWRSVHHQPRAARASRTTTSTSRARAAA